MNTHLPGTVLLLAGAMTVLAGAAAAQESLHTQFAQCRDISSDAQRLQCFDAIKTDQPPTTVETPEPAAAERALEAERQQLAAERAALVPSLLIGLLLFTVGSAITGIAVVGLIAGTGGALLALSNVGLLVVGGFIGGLLAD